MGELNWNTLSSWPRARAYPVKVSSLSASIYQTRCNPDPLSLALPSVRQTLHGLTRSFRYTKRLVPTRDGNQKSALLRIDVHVCALHRHSPPSFLSVNFLCKPDTAKQDCICTFTISISTLSLLLHTSLSLSIRFYSNESFACRDIKVLGEILDFKNYIKSQEPAAPIFLFYAIQNEMTTDFISSSRVNDFDYVIVGGGTAGCVIASRLSEYLPQKKILLIEAGPSDFNNDKVLKLKEWLTLLGGDLDYDYGTTEQPNGKSYPQSQTPSF